MGYVRRAKTTSKVQIPEAIQKEAELIFQHKIAKSVEAHQIPNCMILNLDQKHPQSLFLHRIKS